jgi:hypothetical protein
LWTKAEKPMFLAVEDSQKPLYLKQKYREEVLSKEAEGTRRQPPAPNRGARFSVQRRELSRRPSSKPPNRGGGVSRH